MTQFTDEMEVMKTENARRKHPYYSLFAELGRLEKSTFQHKGLAFPQCMLQKEKKKEMNYYKVIS